MPNACGRIRVRFASAMHASASRTFARSADDTRLGREETTMSQCFTCHGAGVTATENGPQPCTDCFGDGKQVGRGARLEWRLREIERVHREAGGETAADVVWLVHELRDAREALVRILARCQDTDESDETARDVKYLANAALGLYEPK